MLGGLVEPSSSKGKGIADEQDSGCGEFFEMQRKYTVALAAEGGTTQGEDNEDDEVEILEGHEEATFDLLYVGQIFLDREAFKVHMSLYALANKFRYLVRKSEPGKVVLECSGVNCDWRVYAGKIPGCSRFEIKTVQAIHQCTVDERGEFRRHATSSVGGGMMRSKYVGSGSGPRPGALRELMRTDHSVPISYWTAWKSREIAIENGRGKSEEAYATLPSYMQQLAMTNPGTLVALETSKGAGGVQRFKYLFFSFEASIQGFPYMRKVIIIDGTHLKGKFGGCLLTASAQDGNYQIFPIAFGVVDSKNDQSWTWFFIKLLAVVPDAEDLVFVSDRHTAIYSGLSKIYQKSKHCACLLHLQRNVQTIFKTRLAGTNYFVCHDRNQLEATKRSVILC